MQYINRALAPQAIVCWLPHSIDCVCGAWAGPAVLPRTANRRPRRQEDKSKA